MAVTQKTGHLDKPLSNLAVAAFDGVASNIADMIAPVVPVAKRSDKYYTFTKNSWLRIPSTIRTPGSPSKRIEWDISSDSYWCEGYGLAAEWPVEDEAKARGIPSPDRAEEHEHERDHTHHEEGHDDQRHPQVLVALRRLVFYLTANC